MIDTGTQKLGYFNTKALSNSLMRIYEEDYYGFVSYWVYSQPMKQLKDDSILLGTTVDIMLNPDEIFEDKIAVFRGNAPTGQTLKFINALVDTVDCNYDIAYEVVKAQNGGKLRDDITKFKENFNTYKSYYDGLLAAEKTMITTPMYEKAKLIVAEAKVHPFTRTLVNAQSSKGIDVYHQVEVFIEINGVKVKGAIDKIIVDHNKRRIILIDYKTSAKAVNFIESVIEYNYYRQGSFYSELIKSWMKDKNISDYLIMDFIFVVMSTVRSNHHFVYKLSPEDSEIARNGGYLHSGEYVKGWEEIINEIKFLQDLGDWSYPYEIAINKGIVELDIFKKE